MLQSQGAAVYGPALQGLEHLRKAMVFHNSAVIVLFSRFLTFVTLSVSCARWVFCFNVR